MKRQNVIKVKIKLSYLCAHPLKHRETKKHYQFYKIMIEQNSGFIMSGNTYCQV